jgi:hypothetical protein
MTLKQKFGWIGLIWLLAGYAISLVLLSRYEK